MKKEKIKIISFLFFLSLFSFLISEKVFADTNIEEIITSTVNTIKTIAISGSVIIIIIGGFLIMTAGGDPNSVERGKKAIFFGIIGLAIIAGADALANALLQIILPT